MSCHSVIPIAPTRGVMHRTAETHIAGFPLNNECANKDRENPRSCEKKRVGISGCDPLTLRNLTTIAQIAVDSLDMFPLLAIEMILKESAE
jgi:hypothetical protein